MFVETLIELQPREENIETVECRLYWRVLVILQVVVAELLLDSLQRSLGNDHIPLVVREGLVRGVPQAPRSPGALGVDQSLHQFATVTIP